MRGTFDFVKVANFGSLVFWAFAAFAVYWFFTQIAFTLLVFGLAVFLAALLDPPIRALDRRGLSRGFAVAVIALSLFVGTGLAIFFAIPPIVRQVEEFSRQAPAYAQRLQQRVADWSAQHPEIRARVEQLDLRSHVTNLGAKALPQLGRYSLSLVGGVITAVLVLIITLYIVATPKPLVRGVIQAFPKAQRRRALRVMVRTLTQLQNWVKAVFVMMLTVGLVTFVGLWALGVESPLLFAVIAGIGEAIPTIGPILSAIPPFLVTLADDPAKAAMVLALFLVIQQLENNVLVPRIMASSLNLHPVSVMFFVVAIGALIDRKSVV